jgi:hypothetical protein
MSWWPSRSAWTEARSARHISASNLWEDGFGMFHERSELAEEVKFLLRSESAPDTLERDAVNVAPNAVIPSAKR